jgi:hypothetical protein
MQLDILFFGYPPSLKVEVEDHPQVTGRQKSLPIRTTHASIKYIWHLPETYPDDSDHSILIALKVIH